MKEQSDHKLSVVEKVGYATGDLAANLVFQTLMTFLAFFYTDIYNLPTATSTMIISTVGISAALLINPIMGLIADRTNTKWGKFRPWILWTAIPFGLIAILTFRTPDLGEQGKVIYAFVTYTMLLAIYAANNLPYAALSGVLTGNMSERNSLSAYRFVAVMAAQFIVQVFMYPLVLIVGDGDAAAGFSKVMTTLAVFGSLLMLVTFFTTKERVVPKPEQASSVLQDTKDMFSNKPWVIMLVLTTMVFLALALKGGLYIYYFENYISEEAIVKFLSGVGFSELENPSAYAFGIFNGGGIITMIIGILFSKSLADKFGKRDVFGGAIFLATLFVISIYFASRSSVAFVFGMQAIHGFFWGITIPILWAMIADVADYSEWKTGRRATAIVFSAMMIGLKLGLAFGQSLVTVALGVIGYEAGLEQQSDGAINGIRFSVSVLAAVPFLVACGLLFFYKIDKSMEERLEQDLKARRST
ncbi:MFS transporter [Hirschia litorea]|uniref:MFS transporter n=1 Tax=Hirschia litorea TaxID=1199156 RepID=A0ABW2IPE8_9PROT